MTTYLPESVLTDIEQGVMERAGKVERNEIRFRCPAEDHLDVHPSARWNRTKAAWYCDVCGTGGGAFDLCNRLGISIPPSGEGKGSPIPSPADATVQRSPGCTLDQYAQAKRLPIAFLRELGLSTISYQSVPSVRMPYRTPGGRYGGVQLARTTPEDILQIDMYKYWTGSSWSENPNSAEIIIPPNVGELSVRWNSFYDRWIMMYLNDPEGMIELRVANQITGPWSEPHVAARASDYPALYAPYQFPRWNDGPDIYFTMSMFGPYQVFLMRTRIPELGV